MAFKLNDLVLITINHKGYDWFDFVYIDPLAQDDLVTVQGTVSGFIGEKPTVDVTLGDTVLKLKPSDYIEISLIEP